LRVRSFGPAFYDVGRGRIPEEMDVETFQEVDQRLVVGCMPDRAMELPAEHRLFTGGLVQSLTHGMKPSLQLDTIDVGVPFCGRTRGHGFKCSPGFVDLEDLGWAPLSYP